MVFVVIDFEMFSVVWFMLISGLIEISSVISVMGSFMVGSMISVVIVVLSLMFVILVDDKVMMVISVVIYVGFSGLMLIVGVIIIVSMVG